MRRVWSTIIVLAVMLAGAQAFLAPAEAGSPRDVVVGLNADARSLDPVLTLDNTTIRVLRHLYDPLFFRDRTMAVQPELAQGYTVVSDTEWLITLKRGIRFHNGEPFNADAVVATLRFILDPKNAALTRTLVAPVSSVEKVNDYAVRIVTKTPFPTLLENLTEVFIAPPKLLSERGIDYLRTHPVGTGPYRLVSWARDREIVLEKNATYWKGEPQIERVVFRIIPDPSARVAALLAGEVDLVPDVPPEMIGRINASGIATVKSVAGRRVIFVAFNTLKPGPVQNPRVRQALNYALNVDELVQHVLEGYGTRVAGPLIPINKHADPTLQGYRYDPERAKALLREAGYDPTRLRLTLATPNGRYLKDREVGEAIAAQLSRIGIQVELTSPEWGTYLDLVRGLRIGDLYLFGRSDRELDGGILGTWFRTGQSWVTFSDPELDQMIDKTVSIVDPRARSEAMRRLQREVVDRAPWIFLWQQHDLYGVSNRLEWMPRADEQLYLYEAKVVD